MPLLNVVLVNTLYPTPARPKVVGGAERSSTKLAEALAEEGHRVTAIRAIPPGERAEPETQNGVEVLSVPIRNRYWPYDEVHRGLPSRVAWHLRDDWGGVDADFTTILRDIRPDVVHSNNIAGLTTGVWRAAYDAGAAVVHTLRDYYLLCPRTNRFRNGTTCVQQCGECRALTLARRAATRQLHAVVANSQATLEIHRNHGLFASTPIREVAFNVADPRSGATTPDPHDRPVRFGFIGRVARDKGSDLLIESFAAMQQEATLVLAGEADPAVQARAREFTDRQIKFMGFVAPEQFYAQVDVVIAPSLWDEPLPRAALEAFSWGRPVIGSISGGIPEAVGNAGWLFDPVKPGSLTSLLDRIAKNPSVIPAMAKAIQERQPHFTTAAIRNRYLTIYRRAISVASSR